MIVESNGLEVSVVRDKEKVTIEILSQSDDVTRYLRNIGAVEDEETGFKLKSNNRPAYNRVNKTFYVRGQNKDRDTDTVSVNFESVQEANKAFNAFLRLLEKIDTKNMVVPEEPGGTTAARMAIITQSQAKILCLTGKKYYPKNRTWKTAKPVYVKGNEHFNEHIGQFVDVLNKAYDADYENPDDADIVNHHKVTNEEAKRAVEIVQKAFDEAEKESPGTLVAVWRIKSGLRAIDDDNIKRNVEADLNINE